MKTYDYDGQNLDDIFPGENTTTEFMCKVIHSDLSARLRNCFRGKVTVKLHESFKAWASYSADIH